MTNIVESEGNALFEQPDLANSSSSSEDIDNNLSQQYSNLDSFVKTKSDKENENN